MSETRTRRCDNRSCDAVAEGSTLGSVPGWIHLFGGKPYTALDFCSWTCTHEWALSQLTTVSTEMVVR